METQERCKGCRNYLTVPPGQPCPYCYTVNKPKKKANRFASRILQHIDNYANRPSGNNYYNSAYGQPTTYAGYHSPHRYGLGYNNPHPTTSGDSYYSPQQPTVYGDSYNSPTSPKPLSQALSPPSVYGSGYYNQSYQQTHERKRAVLCGVTYKGHPKTLPASVHNVRSMHQLLLKIGFPNASILILTGSNTFFPCTLSHLQKIY